MGTPQTRRVYRMYRSMFRVLVLSFALLTALGGVTGLFNCMQRVAALPSVVFIVSNTNDSGAGSLRQAILDANASAGDDRIEITATGVIHLLSPLPIIDEAVIIEGPGADQLAIDGGGGFRVFESTALSLTITKLTIQNGNPDSGKGGGLRSMGALTLSNVDVLSNTSQIGGGGVYVAGKVQITNGRFQNNRSFAGVGGGLWSTGEAIISGTIFTSNSGPGQGGGAVVQTNSRLTDVHFENNESTTSNGGGLYASGLVTLTNATFISNTASTDGGAMLAFGQVEIYGSRFINNQSSDQGGAVYVGSFMTVAHSLFIGNRGGRGGAIYHGTLNGWLQNTLFARNTATTAGEQLFLNSSFPVEVVHVTAVGDGDGTAIHNANSDLTLTNTIIVSHSTGVNTLNGTVNQDYNLFWGNGSDTQGAVSGGANNVSGDPRFIDPANDNYHVAAGSAAVDAGTNAGITVDFEGELRPFGSGFDIGFDEFFVWPYTHYLPLVMR